MHRLIAIIRSRTLLIGLVLSLCLKACTDESPLSLSRVAQIRLLFVFASQQNATANLNPGLPVALSSDLPQSRALAIERLKAIDRVTISVENVVQERFVIRDQELTIVQAEEGLFAEGDLTIPVEPPEEFFIIDVQAFEGTRLVSVGTTNIRLSPGEVSAEVPVNMLQFPSIFNATVELLSLNSCNLGDGQALANEYRIEFDYTDADGDVLLPGTNVTVSFKFAVGDSGTFGGAPTFTNSDGFKGRVITSQCYRFAESESVEVTMVLRDGGGLESNPLRVTIPKPQGGNITTSSEPTAGLSR